jgi:hypothetical protein
MVKALFKKLPVIKITKVSPPSIDLCLTSVYNVIVGSGSNQRRKPTMIHLGDRTYAIVERCMGAWKWGYPRGHRRAVVQYVAAISKPGAPLRWYKEGELTDGITATTADYWETFVAKRSQPGISTQGGLHRKLCNQVCDSDMCSACQ